MASLTAAQTLYANAYRDRNGGKADMAPVEKSLKTGRTVAPPADR